MEPPIEPDQYTVSELRDALEDVDDPEAIEAILEAEQSSENRTTAREAIEERLEMAEAAMVEERDDVHMLDIEHEADVLTVAGPDEDRELSERLLSNLEGIKNTLEDARQSGGRHEARLRKLENEVGDLAAYTDALEEFLNEEGTAKQVLESVQSDLDSLAEDLADLKPVARSHARTLRDHQESIADMEAELASQESELGRVASEVESLADNFGDFRESATATHEDHAGRLENTEATLDDQSSRIDAVGSQVDSVADAVDDVVAAHGELEGSVEDRFVEAADERAAIENRIDENADSIADNSSQIEQVIEGIGELEGTLGDTGRVDDRFQRIEEQIDALQEWRDQVRSVMAGAVAPSSESPPQSDE